MLESWVSRPYKNAILYGLKIYSFPLFGASKNIGNKIFVWYSVCHLKSIDNYIQLWFLPTVEYDSSPRLTKQWEKQSF